MDFNIGDDQMNVSERIVTVDNQMSEVITVKKTVERFETRKFDVMAMEDNFNLEDTVEMLFDEIKDLIACGEINETNETTIRIAYNTLMDLYKEIKSIEHYPSIIQKVIKFQKQQYDEALKQKDLSLGNEYKYKLFNLFYIEFLKIIAASDTKPSISQLVR